MKFLLTDKVKEEYWHYHVLRSRNMVLEACENLMYKDLALDMLIKILVEAYLADEDQSNPLEKLIEMVTVEYQSSTNPK